MLKTLLRCAFFSALLVGCSEGQGAGKGIIADSAEFDLSVSAPIISSRQGNKVTFKIELVSNLEDEVCLDLLDGPNPFAVEVFSASGNLVVRPDNIPDYGLWPIEEKPKRIFYRLQPGESFGGTAIFVKVKDLGAYKRGSNMRVRDYVPGELLLAQAWVWVFPCKLLGRSFVRQQRALRSIKAEKATSFR
ncbi:MAG: hypothetical protein KDE03_17840 [Rhodobacteraceae bacterium]|nr:hypothetical protein [Paracoccaceae bacterium]